MASPPSPEVLSLALAMQSQLPDCIKDSAFAGIAASGCGLDFECICTKDSYLLLLQNVVAVNCSSADAAKTISLSSKLCTTAVPYLNDSLSSAIIAVTSVFMVLSTSCVIARLVSRRMKGNKLWWDDYSIVGALFLTYGQNFLSFFSATHSGYGKHIIALTYEQITEFVKIQWVSQLVFGCATTVIKLSILLLYYRIFPSRKFKIAFMAVGGLNVAFFIAHTLSVLFSCAPISYNWDKSIPGGHCINLNSLAYGITGAGFITDICIWLLPLPWLWGLQMKLPRKLAVIGIFCLGGLVCLASIIRLPLLTKVNFIDATWTIVDPAIWLLVECNIGIVCACLPIMRPLLQSFAPCVGIRTHGSRNLQTISPFSSRWTRQSKYNRSGSHSGSGTGSSKGLKGSSDPIVVEHELDIASHKGSIKPADNAGFYTTAMPSIVGRSDEKDSV